MSASSLCVTCGTLSQERCRNGPDTFLIRDSGWVSTGPNLEKSCAGISGIPIPAGAPPARGRAAGAGPRRNASRSSLVIRPFGPVPVTAARSTPSSRASRRTLGPACDPAEVAAPGRRGAAPRRRPRGAAPGPAGDGRGGGRRRRGPVPAARPATAAAVTAPSPGSASRIGLPSLTWSPTLTRTSATVPADGAGTSMVALSDSRVTSGSSALTRSPALTCTSMTGTS